MCDISILFFIILFLLSVSFCFFFNDTATTEIYTLSLHDALPIYSWAPAMVERVIKRFGPERGGAFAALFTQNIGGQKTVEEDRKSTRLNSSHSQISYAVFCLKKKKNNKKNHQITRYKA